MPVELVNVYWWNANPDAIARGYWDNELPERILAGLTHFDHEWPEGDWTHLPECRGLVVVVPGQHNAGNVDKLNAALKPYGWVLLMVTGDEEGLFPWDQLDHPNLKRWAFAPNSPGAFAADRLLPFGPTPHGFTDELKTLDWFFAGQVNTPERKAMAEALRGLDGGMLVETDGFAKGLPVADYVTVMNRARVVPCPPAWKHPDSFRVWEALDAGAIPMVPAVDYWQRLFGPDADWNIPWRYIGWWDHIDPMAFSDDSLATRGKAWWLRQQFTYRQWLRDDILELGGPDIAPQVTVLIPTSPIESHPDTTIIRQTIASVQERIDAPIIVMADGIRPEQEHYRQRYTEYLRELVRIPGIVPVIFDEFQHQANMTRQVLDMVQSPFVLFVEHDTPLVGDIDWDHVIDEGMKRWHVVRFLHETDVLEEHAYLHRRRRKGFLETVQWSQRPHLAHTSYYRRIIADHFRPEGRTMIEDTMHGVAQSYPEDHRIAIYYPEGSKLRSTHLDGRGRDPKFEMRP